MVGCIMIVTFLQRERVDGLLAFAACCESPNAPSAASYEDLKDHDDAELAYDGNVAAPSERNDMGTVLDRLAKLAPWKGLSGGGCVYKR